MPHKRRSSINIALARFFLLPIAIITFVTSNTAYAIPDVPFYSGNDILFYDPQSSNCTGSGNASLVGEDNPERIWNYLVGTRGLTNDQAAGVMGNIQAESGFNPGSEEISGGGGFGIAQWTGARRTALENAARQEGVPVNDLAFQLEFLYEELNERGTERPEYRQFDNEWEMIKGQTTVNDTLVAFHHEFEISHLMNESDPAAAVIRERGQFAADALASFGGTSAVGQGGCSGFAGGDLTETLLAYAWPEYHSKPYVTPKPDYRIAYETAADNQGYIGGIEYPGIDCGGFITLLMINSGFEVGYNYGGKIADGAGNTSNQQAWMRENWQALGTSDDIDTATLEPGDVAINGEHTFVYVGDIEGFESVTASASLDGRAPMAGSELPNSPGYNWYRKD